MKQAEQIIFESCIEKLKELKAVAIKNDNPTDKSMDIKNAFWLLKKCIIEIDERVRNLERHCY